MNFVMHLISTIYVPGKRLVGSGKSSCSYPAKYLSEYWALGGLKNPLSSTLAKGSLPEWVQIS